MSSAPPIAELRATSEVALAAGRLDDASAALSAILARDPTFAECWFNLAWVQRAQRRFAAALESYANALHRGIDRPEEVHLNCAAILSDHLHRTTDAIAALEAALAINPDFAHAWLNLGQLHEDLGDDASARNAYGAALALDDASGRAIARLATMDVRAGHAAATRDRLIAALGGELALPDRSEILFALGGALDALGDFDAAFDAFEAANSIALAFSPRRYDRTGMVRTVDRMIAAFPVASVDTGATARPAPVFVCGMFRSGSTLVEQVLGRHSALRSVGESEAIPALAASIADYPDAIGRLSATQIDSYAADYSTTFADAPGIVVDKRCDNFLHIGLIKTLFPGAKIIHSLRNALDNLLSIYFLNFGEAVIYGNDLSDTRHYYGQYRRMMAHWTALYGSDIFDFDYDAFVAGPMPVLKDALAFLGLPWEEACLKDRAALGPVRTASAWHVRQPLHTQSSQRWRNYAHRISPIRDCFNAGH